MAACTPTWLTGATGDNRGLVLLNKKTYKNYYKLKEIKRPCLFNFYKVVISDYHIMTSDTYDQLKAKIFNNLDEMEKSQQPHKVPNLAQEELKKPE